MFKSGNILFTRSSTLKKKIVFSIFMFIVAKVSHGGIEAVLLLGLGSSVTLFPKGPSAEWDACESFLFFFCCCLLTERRGPIRFSGFVDIEREREREWGCCPLTGLHEWMRFGGGDDEARSIRKHMK